MSVIAYVCAIIFALFVMMALGEIWDTLMEIRDELRKGQRGQGKVIWELLGFLWELLLSLSKAAAVLWLLMSVWNIQDDLQKIRDELRKLNKEK